jgi:putative two-component system response regulator
MMNKTQGTNILIVDDAPENLRLLSAVLKHGGMTPRPVTSGRLAIEAAVADPPDLILLDLSMPQMSGVEVCRWFKQDKQFRGIPIIFISGHQEIDEKVEAFRAGAEDYIAKPFQEEEVIARIMTHLRIRRENIRLVSHNIQLEEVIAEQVLAMTASQQATIFALAKLAETRDSDTGHHIERVQTFSKMLAQRIQEMNLIHEPISADFVETLYQTAALHDIGKVGTPDAVLLKPGALSEEEVAEMKKHSELGARTLAAVLKHFPDNQFLRMGVEVARSHHEKWDGGGYPDGLHGREIPLSARIVAVADFYDALTSNRCYRKAFEHERTIQMIREGSGNHFDPDIVTAFLSIESGLKRTRDAMSDQ